MTTSAKGYEATKASLYLYPKAGDRAPHGGARVLLLTEGGVCVQGQWKPESGFLGWHPLPGRDPEKEQAMRQGEDEDRSPLDYLPKLDLQGREVEPAKGVIVDEEDQSLLWSMWDNLKTPTDMVSVRGEL